ncbi:MAG: lipopolysaccharide heptosyltransferase II [Planctomycetota bacterium]
MQPAVERPSKVFIRIPNWVGDVVMATGVLHEVRRQLPDAHLVVGAREHLFPLVESEPFFDELMATPKAGGIRGLFREADRLKEHAFDLALILPNSLETGIVPWLAGIPKRIGYRQGRSMFMTAGPRAKKGRSWWSRRGPRRVPVPMPRYYGELLPYLGFDPVEPMPKLSVIDQDRDWISVWLEDRKIHDRPLVLFTCGAAYGASKLWPAEKFAEMCGRVTARGEGAILLAGPAEVERARGIAEMSPGAVPAIEPTLTFGQLKALIERASAMVTTDTGPRHLGVASGLPIVCVMGPTDPRYTDYGLDQQIILRRTELECMPCQRKVCPLGHHDCMQRIEVDHVDEALTEIRQKVGR